ncbi:MAG: hypothetical protein ABR508_10735, partial [Candidatus Baltobacteraceae bacterium]
MPARRRAIAMPVVAAAVFATAAVFAYVQIGSLALFGALGVRGSLPAALNPAVGERVYASIVRVAPAPYALDMLAQAAFARGDIAGAERTARRLPQGAQRLQWLANIALARGERAGALRLFIAAGDAAAAQTEIDRGSAGGLGASIAAEKALIDRLRREGE